MSGKPRGRRLPGRPSLPGRAKFLRVRESVFDLWRARKKEMGLAKITDSDFAEILLHRCLVDMDGRTRELDEEHDVLPSFTLEVSAAMPMSTPIRTGRRRFIPQDNLESNSNVDVTGVSSLRDHVTRGPTRSWLHKTIQDNPYSLIDRTENVPSDVDDPVDISVHIIADSIHTDDHSDLEETMKSMLDDMNKSDEESSSSGTDDEDDSDQTKQCLNEIMSMDISIECDDEKTLTMIDPLYMYGDSELETCQDDTMDDNLEIQPCEDETTSKEDDHNQEDGDLLQSISLSDNEEQVLNSLNDTFAALTQTDGLEAFAALSEHVRVIVSIEKLLELHGSKCMAMEKEEICGMPVKHTIRNCGSRVQLSWQCVHGHFKSWESSEVLAVKSNNATYVNDALQAIAIIISGNNYNKFVLLAKALNLNIISSNTFLRFQKHCAVPVINDMWSKMSRIISEVLKVYDDICLCGDGRNDSPGHCARYCVYTLMEHATNVIVDFEVLDSRETGGNSVTMEREGLRRLLERMASTLPFNELTTDASSTIMKLVRETKEKFPQFMELFHSLDIWHKAKKLSKCLHQAARLKGCEALKPWIDEIVNHFWFCCQSCERNADELKNTWFGVLHHVCGEHTWAEGECKHSQEAVENVSHTYLPKSSKAMAALRNVVLDKKWLANFSLYVRFRHTSDLESYNSMLTKYAPKRMAFEYPYFIMRIMLAAIDHNMHLFRVLKQKEDGSAHGHRRYSKRTQRYHAKPVKEEKTYSYFPFLISKMLKERCVFHGSIIQPTDDNEFNPKQIAPTLAMKEAPPTEELLLKGPSRFVKPKLS